MLLVMSNNLKILLLVFLVVAGGLVLAQALQEESSNGSTASPTIATTPPATTNISTPTTDAMDPNNNTEFIMTENESVKTIVVMAANYVYTPSEIRVKQGERVEIKLEIQEGMHDFVIDELDVKTQVLTAGQTETVTLDTSQSGEYEFYCSVGNHRQMGMVGKLIVE